MSGYRLLFIALGFVVFMVLSTTARAASATDSLQCDIDVYSLIRPLILNAPRYAAAVEQYSADIYVRANINAIKRNDFVKAVPHMFRFRHGVKEYEVENAGEVHFSEPDIYDVKMHTITGTFKRNNKQVGQGAKYFTINPYNNSFFESGLLSPIARGATKWYDYRIDSVWVDAEQFCHYKVAFIPRNHSRQLVRGYLTMCFNTWTIDEIVMEGKVEHEKFKMHIVMGETEQELYLPRQMELDILFTFVGNKIAARYDAQFHYQDIKLAEHMVKRRRHGKGKRNLTASFTLTTDTTKAIDDWNLMAQLRPYPLLANEQKLYDDYKIYRDTLSTTPKQKSKSRVFMGALGDVLISHYTINLPNIGSVRCSPLINPLLMGYSKSKGYSFLEKFKFNRLFNNDRLLRIVPRIGYNFTYDEFYWKVDANYTYLPQRIGQLALSMGNGSRLYSSDIIDALKKEKNIDFDLDATKLDYYRDDYVNLTHKIELANGLTLETGLGYHRRKLVDKSGFSKVEGVDGILTPLRKRYISFAPRVRLEWTPGMYYYMNGNRKINFRSHAPTFSIDWERGLKGVLGGTAHYERVEFDMEQEIKFHKLNTFCYRIGMGAMTDQEEMYFIDYVNFKRHNLPAGWNDEIGGTFQLLSRKYFNTASEYVRAHITYESPFIFFKYAHKYATFLDSERLYVGVLWLRELHPYVELGYGVGTPVFDIGAFVSLAAEKVHEVGLKFTFELFNR